MPVLLEPETRENYDLRYRQAQKAMVLDDFYTFPVGSADAAEITRLVREHVPGSEEFTYDSTFAGVLVKGLDGAIVAGALYTVAVWSGTKVLMVTHVFTVPEHRGRGFARVAFGMLPSVNAAAGSPAQFIAGTCTTTGARFYASNLCTVLTPGTPLPLAGLIGHGAIDLPAQSGINDCWFLTVLPVTAGS